MTLEEIDGVVSTRSFQMLVQWLYLGRVLFSNSAPEEAITATLEFARIADMCGVTGMESMLAEHIKEVIIANPKPNGYHGDSDRYTHYLTSQHIISAASLPQGHPVRSLFATAAVQGYLQHDNYKFLRESQEVPNFSADLLAAVKANLRTLSGFEIDFKEPLTGMILSLRS